MNFIGSGRTLATLGHIKLIKILIADLINHICDNYQKYALFVNLSKGTASVIYILDCFFAC